MHIHISTLFFFRLFSYIGHCRVLNRVRYARQQVLISFLLYVVDICVYVSPNLPVNLPPPPAPHAL